MNPCGTCRWWKGPYVPQPEEVSAYERKYIEGPATNDLGECHGSIPVGGRNEFRWPVTRRDDGCRGWEPVKT